MTGQITTLPAGWSMEIKDQGAHINEVWLVFHTRAGKATKVFPRDSAFGELLLELALAQ